MFKGPHKLQPLARFGDSQGSIVLGWIAPQVLYVRMDGQCSDGLGATFANRLERAIWATSEFRVFIDLWQLDTYSFPARDRIVAVLKAHKKRFTSLEVLVRSTIVSLGVRTGAIVLGSVVHVYTRPAQFMALMQGRVPQVRALLEPSISPRPELA
ncbi:MAG TPA: hypothetical protein VGP93_04485 [Polyangiaceae bacterium]|jgi:hypothetical protein|nr:hypothetical protein [Polyangiaceae bacterium]